MNNREILEEKLDQAIEQHLKSAYAPVFDYFSERGVDLDVSGMSKMLFQNKDLESMASAVNYDKVVQLAVELVKPKEYIWTMHRVNSVYDNYNQVYEKLCDDCMLDVLDGLTESHDIDFDKCQILRNSIIEHAKNCYLDRYCENGLMESIFFDLKRMHPDRKYGYIMDKTDIVNRLMNIYSDNYATYVVTKRLVSEYKKHPPLDIDIHKKIIQELQNHHWKQLNIELMTGEKVKIPTGNISYNAQCRYGHYPIHVISKISYGKKVLYDKSVCDVAKQTKMDNELFEHSLMQCQRQMHLQPDLDQVLASADAVNQDKKERSQTKEQGKNRVYNSLEI